MQEYYKILGLSQGATPEEIDAAYSELKNKYMKDRFLEGEAGNEAAKNLTKLETAYTEIKLSLKRNGGEGKSDYDFSEVEKLIKNGNISAAQSLLDGVNERNAEWHYLQSVIFYKKNWISESEKQLKIALNMEPHNEKYSESYSRLKQKIEYNDKQFNSNPNSNNNGQPYEQRQMGGGMDSCLTFCLTWCCMDMLCSCCCR